MANNPIESATELTRLFMGIIVFSCLPTVSWRNGHIVVDLLDKMFGPGSWRYDAREQLWIVPDATDTGPGRAYYCVRANGDWFKARLDAEHTQ